MERKPPRTSWKVTVFAVLSGAALALGCGASGETGHGQPRKEKGRLHVDVNFANMCPEFESYLLLPHDIDAGSWAEISVSASDPDDEGADLAFAWRATSGTFSDLAMADTKYLCAAAGAQMLTAEARDSDGCTRELALDVTCLEQ